MCVLRNRTVPPKPISFVKLAASAAGPTSGRSSSTPISDQVPELMYAQLSPLAGTALFVATLLLLIAQLRAGVALFRGSPDAWRIEPRPTAGIIGVVIFLGLVAGGIAPDAFLRPISVFADEFLKVLRPL